MAVVHCADRTGRNRLASGPLGMAQGKARRLDMARGKAPGTERADRAVGQARVNGPAAIARDSQAVREAPVRGPAAAAESVADSKSQVTNAGGRFHG